MTKGRVIAMGDPGLDNLIHEMIGLQASEAAHPHRRRPDDEAEDGVL